MPCSLKNQGAELPPGAGLILVLQQIHRPGGGGGGPSTPEDRNCFPPSSCRDILSIFGRHVSSLWSKKYRGQSNHKNKCVDLWVSTADKVGNKGGQLVSSLQDMGQDRKSSEGTGLACSRAQRNCPEKRGRHRSGDDRASVLVLCMPVCLRPKAIFHRETKALTTRVHVSLRRRPRVPPKQEYI